MSNIAFNCGIEYWSANFYNNTAICFPNIAVFEEFMEYLCNKLNSNKYKLQLFSHIKEPLSSKIKELFSSFTPIDTDSFLQEPVKYFPGFNYIKFPTIINSSFKTLEVNISINPGGKENPYTKIYSIVRFKDCIQADELTLFYSAANDICKSINKLIERLYFQIYTEFVNNTASLKINKIEYSKIKKTYKLISSIVGSDKESITKFLNLVDYPDKWRSFCKNHKEGRFIIETLENMNKFLGNKWKLSDYNWVKQSVHAKSDIDKSTIEASYAYIGFKGDENGGYFIGVCNSTPRSQLLPIHLDIIRNI